MRRLALAGSPVVAHWLGITLIGTGLLGLLLSVAGLLLVITVGSAAEAAFMRELNTLDQALAATSDGLTVADSAIAEASSALASVSTTIGSANRALTNTQPAMNTLQEMTGTGIPETISSTRQALASAQEAAKTVDTVLRNLARVGVPYNPEVPLHTAIGQVSTSLADLPAALEEVSAGLGTTSENISILADDLAQVGLGIDTVAANVGEAAAVVEQYQIIVRDLRGELADVRRAAPAWALGMRLGAVLLLIWLGLAQIGLLMQGQQLLGARTKDEGE